MQGGTRRTVFKNPPALIGLALVFGSFVGLVLAIGNLVSLQYTPRKLVERLSEQYALTLTEAGVSPDIVHRVQSGDVISEAVRSKLSREQVQALKLVENALPALINAVSQATEVSRQKSHTGIGVCAILMVVGAVLAARAFRKTKRPRSELA